MRPTRDQWAMSLAKETAKMSTCCRRNVGCVLLNGRGHVIATGYNGVAAGLKHCNEPGKVLRTDLKTMIPMEWEYPHACSGVNSPSGTNLDGCQAIHAEQNALLQCKDVYSIHTCFTTASPCMTCAKLLMNTSCERVVFCEEYPHPEVKDMWVKSGREWVHLDDLR